MTHDPDDTTLLTGVDGSADPDASVARDDEAPEPLSDALAAALAALPEAIEPERDLWSGIDDAIAPEEPPARARGPRFDLLIAAAAALLATIGGTARWVQTPSPPETVQPAPADDTAQQAARAADAWAADLHRANEALVAQVEARDDLSPEARATIEENLSRIDAAIAEVQTLLEERPDDPDLRRWLTDTESLKQRVLVSALHLPEGS